MQIIQLLVSLSILIFIHELGHFLFAKLFKTRVEKFYLFFNPKFSLFKFKKGETEYGIGWLPLGGYVKIAGMIDESMDKDQMAQPPQPWEYRSKKPWQKLLIVLGGIIFNFLLAIVIYTMVVFTWGKTYISVKEVNRHGVMTDSIGEIVGFRNGDKIVSVNNKNVTDFSDVFKELLISDPHTITINRNNIDTTIILTNEQIGLVIKNKTLVLYPRISPLVLKVIDSSVAMKSGLIAGDKIISIDSTKINYFDELKYLLAKNANKTCNIQVLRNYMDTLTFTVNIPSNSKLGFFPNDNIENIHKIDTINYNFLQAIPAGFKTTFAQLSFYVKQFKLLFTPKTEAYKSLGSFITIGKMFPKKWNWQFFWNITALLSIMLAFINVLPIPALDGGHALFALYEMIFRKKPNEKFLEKAQMVGLILLLVLIFYALGNDIYQNFIK